ncbi:Nitrogen permease regulator 2-like protein [Smittium mucronatum]|uniref:Nitrogen permease regulator 2-like protein n=1 Tax=Smittium mucronatum TaxID=133383 RepID=A0A1R0GX66_9FUNG|nr:Nitrogen permease regulator 2-like protein [Smittium mucronatum]
MLKQIPQIFSIFLVKFHTVRGPEIDFVIPKEKTFEIAGYDPSQKKNYFNDSNATKLPPCSDASRPISEDLYSSSRNLSSINVHMTSLSSKLVPKNRKILDFNSISSILMPKQVLYERVIKIHYNGYIILGYPVGVRGPYERNALIFNFCFVLKDSIDSSLYNTVVKRFGHLMKGLEIKMGFLRNRIYKGSLKLLVEKLMNDLNMFGESQILLTLESYFSVYYILNISELPVTSVGQDQSNVEFNIKIFPSFEKIIQVNSYDVPILIIDPEDLIQEGDDRDIGMERVMRHINNINHVRRISQLADIPEDRVIHILQHLHYYGCIKFTEIFQFSNNYSATPQLRKLLESDELQTECIEFVTTKNTKLSNMPSITIIFRLYSSLKGDLNLSEWMISQQVDWNTIDIRKLIMFGVLYGLVSQMRIYPILIDYEKVLNLGWNADLIELLDGSRHLDEISFIMGIDSLSLRTLLSSDPSSIALISRQQ